MKFKENFVYFMWNNRLKKFRGKKCLVANSIRKLQDIVNSDKKYYDEVDVIDESVFDRWEFVYFDPEYEEV